MKTAALLRPGISPRSIEPFRNTDCGIKIHASLEDSEHHDAALIFGGDGTIHRYLPQLHQHQIPVLMVPKGGGNDFAKALGITNERVALQAWQQFCSGGKNVKLIDLGLIKTGSEQILFCCVAGMGLDSVANARANRMPAWLRGTAGYLLAALWSVASFVPAEMRVIAGQREIQRSAFFVAVGNAHRYGGGMKVTPQAQLDDGLLDICLVGKMNKFKLLLWLPTIFFGQHVRISQVEYLQAEQTRIESGRPLDVYADGDYACQTPVEISLLPQVLRVIVPV